MLSQEIQHSFIYKELYIPTVVQDLTFEEYVSLFFLQGTRMEGYADPSTAAQDAMVNMIRCEVLKQ